MNKWIRGTNAVVFSAAVVGIFIILTIFLHSIKGFQLDMTKNKSFTLSDQTISTLSKLDKDIHIVVFTNPSVDPYITRQVTDLIQQYKVRSSKVTYEEFDMLKQPSKAKQYGVDANGTVIFESGDQKRVVNFYEVFIAGEQQDGSYRFSGEEKFTQALTSLTSTEKHSVYVLSGHEEIPLNQLTALSASLEGANYVVKDLNLYREGKIPDDAEMLLLLGPQTDINDKEAELINAYLDDKGKIYLALGFNKDMKTAWKNIDGIMKRYGVNNEHAVAIEEKQTSLFDPLTIIPEYGTHEITQKLADYNLLTNMALAIPLNADAENADWTTTALLDTTADAYGETDIALLMQSQTKQDDKDIKGPLHLGYAVENKEKQPKAVILGSSTFLMDQEILTQGNKDFALNSIGWLQEQTDQVTIRPREGEAYQEALITLGQANTIFYTTLVALPLLFLLFGGFVWWRRKRG
ncbi:GldG family protein [Paenibacillus eucommiae]|uniref:ABC transporter n=1 Tax=Paenibacillus eucommiae TaxID=1355755 RepID=A0ABS4J045_9BACL|nr:GldG family protein [Paenibacillus eucommiae]MBP1992695.1 hypothetical protein [Paenibacillus eucommiae]